MATSESCGTCRFFLHYGRELGGRWASSGLCRRRPPVLFQETAIDGETAYEGRQPRVDEWEWCGEYERENEASGHAAEADTFAALAASG